MLPQRGRPPAARRLLRHRELHPGVATAPARRDRRGLHRDTDHLGVEEYDLAAQIAVSRHYWLIDGELRTLSSPHRYVWPSELDLMARLAGMVRASAGATGTARRSPARARRTSPCGSSPRRRMPVDDPRDHRAAPRHRDVGGPPAVHGRRDHRLAGASRPTSPARSSRRPRRRGEHGHRLRPAARRRPTATRVLDLAAEVTGGGFVAGAYVADEPGDAFDLAAYRRRRRRPSPAAAAPRSSSRRTASTRSTRTAGSTRSAALGAEVDRFIGFELGPMFVPVRPHRLARRVPRPARASRTCIGAKHSSLSRAARVGAARRSATRCGPTSWCSPATTSPSTWSCTAPTTCSACRRSPPTRSPRRDRVLGDGRPGASTSSTTCCSTSGQFAFRAAGARLPPRRRDVPRAAGLGEQRRHAARRAPPARRRTVPCSPTSLERLERRAAVRSSPQVKKLATARRAAGRTSTDARRRRSRSTTTVDPTGPLADARRRPRRVGRRPRRRRTASPCCRWRAGTAPPTAARPTSCAAAGRASAPAAAGWCGARRPRCGPTAGPTRTSSCSTSAPSTTSPRCAALARPGPGGRPPAHPLGPVRPARGRARARAPPTAIPCSTPASAPARRACSPTTSSTSWPAQYVDAAVLAQQAGFDFVDVKHCHGYLLHELLSAHDRPGRYGGDLAGRTRFLRTVVAGIRDRAPGLGDRACGCRRSTSCPSSPGADGVGVPARTGAVPLRVRRRRHRAGHRPHRDPRAARRARGARHRPRRAPPPAARTTTRTSSGRPTSRRPTATSRPRTRSSAWPASSRPPPS